MLNDRILATLITLVGTGILATLGFLAREFFQARAARRLQQRQFASALAAEIDYNVRDLEAFLIDSVDMAVVRDLIQSTGSPPHVTDAKHTRIYNANIERMFVFRTETISRCVEFYSHLDKLENQIAGLQLESFHGISTSGKIATVEYIFDVARKSIELGRQAESAVTAEKQRLTRPWWRGGS